MIMILLKEEDDARNIPDEQKLLYHQVFEKRGMKPVDYLHLISVAKRLEVKRGEAIIHCGKKNKYLYLVKQGSLSVRKPETKMQPIAMIERHQFIGEMSFLNWSNTLTMVTSLQQQEAEELKSSLTSNTNNDSKEVVDSSVDEEAEDRLRSLGKFISLVQGYVGLDSSDDGKRNFPTQKTDNSTKKRGVNSLEDGFLVQADVVAEEDCVIFAWKFKDLYQLMNQYPSLGFVFERCLSNDLHQKMAFRALPSSSTSSSPPSTSSTPTTSSDLPSTENTTSVGNDQNQGSIWEEDMRMRYKQILFGGLMDGEINKIEKQILHQFRQRYSISMLEHNQLLMDLNWTPEDYERGYQLSENKVENTPNILSKSNIANDVILVSSDQETAHANREDILKDYKMRLNASLTLTEEQGIFLSEEVKKQLRDYRKQYNISTKEQCDLLTEFGWTFDDYEIGKRSLPTKEITVPILNDQMKKE
eukprot:gene3404-3628_t